jgi:hypothetical protein
MSTRPRVCDGRDAVFVIGAARSGTKLLRDLLATHPALVRVPYDVNFLWQSALGFDPGHDEYRPEWSGRTDERRLMSQLRRAAGSETGTIVEKTVGNSLRVAYLSKLFPAARFVFLARDGFDVVESARRQWTQPTDWRYAIAKARRSSLTSAPGYMLRYGWMGARRAFRVGSTKPPVWGPRYEGIEDDIATMGVTDVCARQWVRCVERSLDDLSLLAAHRVHALSYAALVANPVQALSASWAFLGLEAHPQIAAHAATHIQVGLEGGGRRNLTASEITRISDTIEPLNRRLDALGLGLACNDPSLDRSV